jgi:hypothetical protein
MVYTKAALYAISILYSLAIASWIISVLAQNDPYAVSGQLFGYAVTELVVGILRIPVSCGNAFTQKRSKGNSFFDTVAIGLFIWNCVLLFNQIGIDNVHTNAYTLFVYVMFILYCIGFGIGILVLCGGLCGACIFLGCMDEKEEPKATEPQTKEPMPTPTIVVLN